MTNRYKQGIKSEQDEKKGLFPSAFFMLFVMNVAFFALVPGDRTRCFSANDI